MNRYGATLFLAESAGLEPGKLNPYVVRVLAEDGIDITGKETRNVSELLVQKRIFDIVVTVCSKDADERCPIFPGKVERHHWPFDDPSKFTGTDEGILSQTRIVRDAIKKKILEFIQESADHKK